MSVRANQGKGLPTGTVTFLFADIEGSTRLLNALGDRFRSVRRRSREIVRDVATRYGGHEVDWAGDGVFLAFARARDAVVAAVDLQRALSAEPWPPEEAIRLRIGIHTGEPHVDGDGYVGVGVVVAARICAAAHGGQVVISQSTREIVGDELLADVSFRPLGHHRLKDIAEPEPLFQLVARDLEEAFPPLATLGGSTLPTLHHRLVGRGQQVDELEQLLARPDVRLVTVTGPGGAGKSRLALEVATAAAASRPVHLVGLASIADPGLVPSSIARALGTREKPGQPLWTSIADALAGKRALVYLDNLEHLSSAAAHVRLLLDAVPDLDVLATSRTPLRLSDEHVLPLDPLPVDAAVELFVERARSRGVVLAEESLPTIGGLCKRLDCLPLAIELVAARLTFLSPSQLLQALESGAMLELEGPVDLPERQRTLRATLNWSYGLLTESQRALHGALALFPGGCMLDDARAVADASESFLADLESLVLASLVRGSAAHDEIRLSMLVTVREHALARLESEGRNDELRDRHAARFVELSLGAESGLAGPEQAAWADRLERELDNLRAALDWQLQCGRVEDMLRATSALERFWRSNAHVSEARRRLAFGIELAGDLPSDVRGLALRTAGHLAMGQSDWHDSSRLLDDAIDLLHESGRGYDEVVALGYRSFVALRLDEPERARTLGAQALEIAREIGDKRALAYALMALGDVAWVDGEHARALEHYTEAVELARSADDRLLLVDAVYNLGMAAFQGSNVTRARAAFVEALDLADELRDAPHTAAARFMLAELDVLAGDTGAAREHALESLARYTDLEDARSRARCLVILAAAAEAEGSLDDAARLLGAADAARGDDGPDGFEQAVLQRLESQLESALGAQTLKRLRSAGTRLRDLSTGDLVPVGTKG